MKRLVLSCAIGAAAIPQLAVASVPERDVTVTLVTHDSFPGDDDGTSLNAALDAFSAETGIDVEILRAGDAGVMVSKAILTAGNPEGDVLYGIDNTNLSRAVDAGVFEPYEAIGLDAVSEDLRSLALGSDGEPAVTPIDFGDVCVNVDTAWFAEAGLDLPTDLASLADPAYRDLLVVENPASSSPGLAFLLATIAEFGDDWPGYWADLADNGLSVVDDWSGAYYEEFTAIGGGSRPLVVSYGSSPPYEILGVDDPPAAPITTVLADTCFRQVEFAGVLAGTDVPEAAQRLVDFLLSVEFQTTVPENLYVFPANADVELADVLAEFSVIPDEPLSLDPADIAEHREEWLETWTEAVAT